jgi:hypothetical protein
MWNGRRGLDVNGESSVLKCVVTLLQGLERETTRVPLQFKMLEAEAKAGDTRGPECVEKVWDEQVDGAWAPGKAPVSLLTTFLKSVQERDSVEAERAALESTQELNWVRRICGGLLMFCGCSSRSGAQQPTCAGSAGRHEAARRFGWGEQVDVRPDFLADVDLVSVKAAAEEGDTSEEDDGDEEEESSDEEEDDEEEESDEEEADREQDADAKNNDGE